MLKKTFFVALVAMLVAFGASSAMARNTVNGVAGTQIDGMAATDGLPLPAAADLQTHINPGGLGDSLIFGYYNARFGANLFNIVNTSPNTAVKARVRFREGERSAEVLDFNVCLSAGDRWTAIVLGDDAGPGFIVALDDDTLTAPPIPDGGVDFKYFGTGNPSAWVTAGHTLEGYFEVLGTVAVADTPPDGTPWGALDLNGAPITNVRTQTTPLCQDAVFLVNPNFPGAEVPNVLMGQNHIVPLDTLESLSYNAAGVANCVQFPIDAAIGNETPNFGSCADSFGFFPFGLEYALTKSNVFAAYDNILGATELILTFPTMHHHRSEAGTALELDVLPGVLNEQFDADTDINSSGICWEVPTNAFAPEIAINVALWDDEEHRPTTQTQFSPNTEEETAFICNEVNVMGIGNTEILDSMVRRNINTAAGFDIGWVRLGLTAEVNHVAGVGPDHVAMGLPALGYVIDDVLDAFSAMRPIQYDSTVSTLGTAIVGAN